MGPGSKEAVSVLREKMKNAGKKGGHIYQNALMSITGRKKLLPFAIAHFSPFIPHPHQNS